MTRGKHPNEVLTRPAVEPHVLAVLAGYDPEAVVLDFMQPAVAGRRLRGLLWGGRGL
jgi:hypothetical protein